MNIPTKEVERPTTPIWLGSSRIGSGGRPSATKGPFERSFCGVLLGLILAIAVILSVVAVMAVSYR